MSSFKVLVVDDYEPWRRSIRSMLNRQPELQVIGEASDGMEAVETVQTLTPDLVLLDIGLPTLNGIEVANRIHRSFPAAKVLFLTQEDDPDVLDSALSNNARGYVLKRDAARELLLGITSILNGEEFVSSGLKRQSSSEL